MTDHDEYVAVDGLRLRQSDLVNEDDWDDEATVWAIGNGYGVLAVVFAESWQLAGDVLGIAADADKLKSEAVDATAIVTDEHGDEYDDCGVGIMRLGIAAEPYRCTACFWMRQLPTLRPSYLASLRAHLSAKTTEVHRCE